MRKPFQTISLRTKLVAVIAVISAAASIPLLYLGYTDTYKHAVEAAREQFGSITRTLHEDLQISYLNTQALTVEKAASEKSDIISELDAIEEWIVSNKLGEMDSMFKFMEQSGAFTWRSATSGVNFFASHPSSAAFGAKTTRIFWAFLLGTTCVMQTGISTVITTHSCMPRQQTASRFRF